MQASENFFTRGISNEGPESVTPREICRAIGQFRDEYVTTALSHHQLGNPLSSRSETDDHEMIAIRLRLTRSPA